MNSWNRGLGALLLAGLATVGCAAEPDEDVDEQAGEVNGQALDATCKVGANVRYDIDAVRAAAAEAPLSAAERATVLEDCRTAGMAHESGDFALASERLIVAKRIVRYPVTICGPATACYHPETIAIDLATVDQEAAAAQLSSDERLRVETARKEAAAHLNGAPPRTSRAVEALTVAKTILKLPANTCGPALRCSFVPNVRRDIAAVDAALARSTLSAAGKDVAKRNRDDAERLLRAGKRHEAAAALATAKELVGLAPWTCGPAPSF